MLDAVLGLRDVTSLIVDRTAGVLCLRIIEAWAPSPECAARIASEQRLIETLRRALVLGQREN